MYASLITLISSVMEYGERPNVCLFCTSYPAYGGVEHGGLDLSDSDRTRGSERATARLLVLLLGTMEWVQLSPSMSNRTDMGTSS